MHDRLETSTLPPLAWTARSAQNIDSVKIDEVPGVSNLGFAHSFGLRTHFAFGSLQLSCHEVRTETA